MAEHNELGEWGEEKACEYMESEGYVIIDRDWKFGKRDLDIIAQTSDGNTLVFVEVKTRTDNRRMEPEQAVDKMKIRNLAKAAHAYVKTNKIDKFLRFDIISVIGSEHIAERIEHIESAFNPLLL